MSQSKLNPKQKAVIKKIAEGKSQTQAYKEAYGVTDDNVAASKASRLVRTGKVKNALQEAMRRKGLDEDMIVDTLIEMRNNRDWRAKDAFIEKSGKFLGYGDEKGKVSISGESMKVDFIIGDE